MKILKNSLGIKIINDNNYELIREILNAYFYYFLDGNQLKLDAIIEEKCKSLKDIILFEDAIWNQPSRFNWIDAVNIFTKKSNRENDAAVRLDLMEAKYKILYNKIFFQDPDIISLIRKSNQIRHAIDFINDPKWNDTLNLNSFREVINYLDLKAWLDNNYYLMQGRYEDIITSTALAFVRKNSSEFIEISLQLNDGKSKIYFTKSIFTSIGAPETSGYFLGITNSKSSYDYVMPKIFSSALLFASGFEEIAYNLKNASFISTTNIILCLTFDEHPESGIHHQKGWYNKINSSEIEISIGDKNVFFVAFNDSNPVIYDIKFSERIIPLGFNLKNIGPLRFIYDKKFKIYETPDMHQHVIDQLADRLVN
jgi:hypothetical protein